MDNCPPSLSAGELRTLVSVERETRTPDAAGGYASSWAIALTFWAAVKSVTGNEFFAQQQLWPNGGAKIKARWADMSTLLETDRLTFDGKTYNVRSIEDLDAWHSVGYIKAESGVVQ